MRKLKGVIFSIDNVFVGNQGIDLKIMENIKKLLDFLRFKGIVPVVLANRQWVLGDDRKPLEDYLESVIGPMKWFITNRDGLPHKPRKASIDHVLNTMGWDSAETIYVGNSETDRNTAVNGKVLFVNATWFKKSVDYGFEFSTPKEIGKFIDIFCLREHLWHYQINEGIEFYALAPYSTYIQEYEIFSRDAKNAAKFGMGHPDFWTKYLI